MHQQGTVNKMDKHQHNSNSFLSWEHRKSERGEMERAKYRKEKKENDMRQNNEHAYQSQNH